VLSDEERLRYAVLATRSDAALSVRVALLLQLSEWMYTALRVVDLGLPAALSPLAVYFRRAHIRRLLCVTYKTKLISKVLLDTAIPPVEQHQLFQLKLDHFKAQALEQRHGGMDVDRHFRRTIFGQSVQQLHLHKHKNENKYGDPDRDPHRFHIAPSQRAWKCIFAGLYADDFGGPYNETIDKMCAELQSPQLSNLFIACPNQRENIGKNRNHFIPNPSATGPLELSCFEFVGRLMGLAIRSGNLLNLDFTVRHHCAYSVVCH
jgi:hypothetical protein